MAAGSPAARPAALRELVRRFAEAHGPSGSEEQIRGLIVDAVGPYADEVRVDALGNVIARQGGTGGGRRIMVAAHMDEVGLIVTHVEDEGFLRFAAVGGINPRNLPGQRVVFANGTVGVIGLEKIESEKDWKVEKMFIDVGAATAAAARERAGIGDAAVFWRSVDEQGERIVGKALDDRSGCAALVRIMQEIKGRATPHDVYYVFSVQEEVGGRGARTAAFAIQPEIGLAIDVTPAGDTPKGLPLPVALGKGAAIKVKDSSLIAHPAVKRHLVETAERHGIPYQLEVLPFGGTDAGPIHLTAEGVPSGVVSIPARYLHTPAEMIDLGDLAAAVGLLAEALASPWPGVPAPGLTAGAPAAPGSR